MSNVTCNPEYSFILSPVWSNNCDIELILSDIPFISVGILAFGVTAFFLTVRRFTFSVVSLYFSVLLSFAATIIDLAQTLIRDLSHVTISSSITTREILLALSLTLRFLFYWLYVSEPPIGEQRTPSFRGGRSNFLSLNPQDELHSGNWARWGVAGSYAKFALLATIPAITALQIIWRVFQRYNGYSPVYAADVTLEVVVSVLLLLKLLLNTVPTSSILQTHTFKECGFPILALIFNICISIGGLVHFAFTESTVGRLLQGTELFILIVFMTIYHFFCHKKILATTHMRGLAAEKVELPEQLRASTFRLSPPVVSTPRVSTLSSLNNQGRNVNTDAVRHSILASVGRATPLVSWRVSRTKLNQDEDRAKLWDQSEAEKGAVDPPGAGRASARPQSMVSVASAMDEESTDWRDIANDSIPYTLATADRLSVRSRSRDGSLCSEQIWNAIRVDAPRRSSKLQPLAIPATETSSNGSGAAVVTTAPSDLPSQDLPIHGLDGVTGQSPTLSSNRLSGTSLDQLKDLQNELEKMMAILRSFSSSSPGSSTSISSSINNSNDDGQARQSSSTVRRSFSTGRQSSSTCAPTLSDFSLSNFPSPPPQFDSLPTPLPTPNLRLKEKKDRRARFGSPHDPIFRLPMPPRIPAALTDVPSSPHSDLTSDSPFYADNGTLPAAAGRSSRSSPGGTQYEITSFIDDLTTPGGHRGSMMGMSLDESEGNPLDLAGMIEDSVSLEASPYLSTMPSRPSPLRVAVPMGSSPSSTRSRLSAVPIFEEQASEPDSDSVELVVQRGIRPLILPSMTISRPSSHSKACDVNSGVRSSRGMFGLPPRPGFRVPKRLPKNIQAPPPLILRSDDEYFAKQNDSILF